MNLYLNAEIGINRNGNRDITKKLIDVAAAGSLVTALPKKLHTISLRHNFFYL